jgi:tetratricopeptide (TPR) repeat protein
LNKLNKTDEEILAYKRAVALKPDHANALERLGTAYFKAGRFKDALAAFDQLKTFKGDAKSYNFFGESLLELDRADEAISAFNTAVGMNSDFAKARYNLGRAELKRGNRDAALIQYELLRTTNTDWADKLYVLINP